MQEACGIVGRLVEMTGVTHVTRWTQDPGTRILPCTRLSSHTLCALTCTSHTSAHRDPPEETTGSAAGAHTGIINTRTPDGRHARPPMHTHSQLHTYTCPHGDTPVCAVSCVRSATRPTHPCKQRTRTHACASARQGGLAHADTVRGHADWCVRPHTAAWGQSSIQTPLQRRSRVGDHGSATAIGTASHTTHTRGLRRTRRHIEPPPWPFPSTSPAAAMCSDPSW